MSIYYTKGIQNSRLFLYDDDIDEKKFFLLNLLNFLKSSQQLKLMEWI